MPGLARAPQGFLYMSHLINSHLPILLIDDEPNILLSHSRMLRMEGMEDILTIDDSRQVMPLLAKQDVAVITMDLKMPYITGDALLVEINHYYPHIPVIIMTAVDEIETAVKCMKAGAFDYLVKPADENLFIASIKKALEFYTLRSEVSSLKQHLLTDRLEHAPAFSSIITQSKKMHAVFKYVEVIAPSHQPVLITGETGVGKELIARSIHSLSRRTGVFVAVNIAGLDDTMFSDTLFGHKKGSFTGAEQSREGLIAQASGGTLFLDEIGDLNEASQAKLLRLLQEREYYPLGADVPKTSDARIIVATNQDLQKSIASGRFRKDLYYRLRAHQIHIPSLRERLEDIPLLVDCFLGEAALSLNKKKPTPPHELITFLSTSDFPGNVRELQAMVFDAVARHRSGVLSMDSFREIIAQERLSLRNDSPPVQGGQALYGNSGRLPTLKEAESSLIAEALKRSNGNQGIAASLLGITRQALNKRLLRTRDGK